MEHVSGGTWFNTGVCVCQRYRALGVCVLLLFAWAKLFAWGGGGTVEDMCVFITEYLLQICSHVLGETTSRGLCGLVCRV